MWVPRASRCAVQGSEPMHPLGSPYCSHWWEALQQVQRSKRSSHVPSAGSEECNSYKVLWPSGQGRDFHLAGTFKGVCLEDTSMLGLERQVEVMDGMGRQKRHYLWTLSRDLNPQRIFDIFHCSLIIPQTWTFLASSIPPTNFIMITYLISLC